MFFSDETEEETPFFDNAGPEVRRSIFNEGPPTQDVYDIFNTTEEEKEKSIISALDQFDRSAEDFAEADIKVPSRDTPFFNGIDSSDSQEDILSLGGNSSKQFTFADKQSRSKDEELNFLVNNQAPQPPSVIKKEAEISQFSESFTEIQATTPLKDSKSKPDKPTAFEKLFKSSLPAAVHPPESVLKPEPKQQKPQEKQQNAPREAQPDPNSKINKFIKDVIEAESSFSKTEENLSKQVNLSEMNSLSDQPSGNSTKVDRKSMFNFKLNNSRAQNPGADKEPRTNQLMNKFSFKNNFKPIQPTNKLSKSEQPEPLKQSNASSLKTEAMIKLKQEEKQADLTKNEDRQNKDIVQVKISRASTRSKDKKPALQFKFPTRQTQSKSKKNYLSKSRLQDKVVKPESNRNKTTVLNESQGSDESQTKEEPLGIKDLAKVTYNAPQKFKIKSVAPSSLFQSKIQSAMSFKATAPEIPKKEPFNLQPVDKRPKGSVKTEGHESLSQMLFDEASDDESEARFEAKEAQQRFKPMKIEQRQAPKKNTNFKFKMTKEEPVQQIAAPGKSVNFSQSKTQKEVKSDFVGYMVQLMDHQRDYLKIKQKLNKTKSCYRQLAIYDKDMNKRVEEAISIARECLSRPPI